MALEVGTRLGPYEIVAPIGAGGMGEVYKASDTRLNRTVAIKVLQPYWEGHPDMKERFDREARTIASLTHPHICTLHDIGRDVPSTGTTDPGQASAAQAIDFLVMEYLEGKTLAQRLEKGALPLDEALKVAVAIADALDKAHRMGIVHRDLKPSNVMLTPSGPKLLDFGLAKLTAPVKPASTPSAPTGVVRPRADATSPGMMVGTLQYMAPEQIEGAEADARTDIFAFGSVLHEMVTGTKAFEGKNRAMLITAIATLELDPLSTAQPAASPALDHVAKRCLAKDPDDRWQTAHDLALQLRWVAGGGVSGAPPVAARGLDKRLSLVLAAALVLMAVMAWPAVLYLRGSQESEAFQFRIPVAGLSDADIALSPDGQTVALVARPNTQEPASLFVRPVGSTTFRKLGGTDDASLPFWSPDSNTIAYAAGGRLKRVDAAGGAPKDLGEAPGFAGGAWNAEGTIVFGSAKGLFRVSAEGGKPEAITTVEKPETGHFWPSFLPDGRRYVYLAWSGEAANRAVFAGTLGSQEKTKLMAAESNAAYASPGYLVFHRESTLFAQPFNADTLALAGDPVHIADQLGFSSANGRGHFDVSQNGVLLYFQGGGATALGGSGRAQITAPNATFGWRDRSGRQLGLAGEQGAYGDIDLSPDAKFVAITRQDGAGADIWVIDWERAGVPTKLTLDPADDLNPVWSPTGDRIAFTTYRKGNADVYVKNANGVGPETPLLNSSSNEMVEDWSKDGKYIAYKLGQDAFEDLYVLPVSGGDKKPIPVVTGPYRKDEPQFSYDGKWLAYTSNESGTFEVYVLSFPALDQKQRISAIGGGGQPRWRKDGKEIFYRAPDDGVMAVDLKLGAGIEAGIPRRLFGAISYANSRDPVRHQWNVTADGQRFLLRYGNGAGNLFGGGQGERQSWGSTPRRQGVNQPQRRAGRGLFRVGLL
ncbi:MAG: protein kinase [Acidobacteriota bacterium]|nr:protein kinase [Acidobacteriota bacterium]